MGTVARESTATMNLMRSSEIKSESMSHFMVDTFLANLVVFNFSILIQGLKSI